MSKQTIESLVTQSLCGFLGILFLISTSNSATLTATVTADNYYGLYYGSETSLTFVGRNEKGSAGNPGPYNWILPETFSNLPLSETDRLYIVQWNEGSGPANTDWQALLGQFVTSDGGLLVTNRSDWGYFLTSEPNPGSFGDTPSADALEVTIGSASWTPPGFSTPNGTGIWAHPSYTAPGGIDGITRQADWISRTSDTDATYFLTVYRSIPVSEIYGREIVTSTVAEPSTVGILGIGIVVGFLINLRRNDSARVIA